MKIKCYWNDGDITEVNQEWLEGVSNIKNIDSVEVLNFYGNQKLAVMYKNNDVIYYDNVHGTWGSPCKIKF